MKGVEWRKHIAAQGRSGKSVAAYCREHELREQLFYYWRRRKGGSFVQVSGREPLQVTLPGGAILQVPESQIEAVLRALRAQ